MELKVRFRFNKTSGEVEVFDVEDQGVQTLPDAEHNRVHDRAAAALGRVIERDPRVGELLPGPIPGRPAPQPEPEPAETEPQAEQAPAAKRTRRSE